MPHHVIPPPPRALLTPVETARALGASAKRLSAWEKAGLLLPALRTLGGHRRYHYADVKACARTLGLGWAQLSTPAERAAFDLAVERPGKASR